MLQFVNGGEGDAVLQAEQRQHTHAALQTRVSCPPHTQLIPRKQRGAEAWGWGGGSCNETGEDEPTCSTHTLCKLSNSFTNAVHMSGTCSGPEANSCARTLLMLLLLLAVCCCCYCRRRLYEAHQSTEYREGDVVGDAVRQPAASTGKQFHLNRIIAREGKLPCMMRSA